MFHIPISSQDTSTTNTEKMIDKPLVMLSLAQSVAENVSVLLRGYGGSDVLTDAQREKIQTFAAAIASALRELVDDSIDLETLHQIEEDVFLRGKGSQQVAREIGIDHDLLIFILNKFGERYDA